MVSLLAAATFFVAIHFLISGSALRDRIVEAIGEGPFRGVFSLAIFEGRNELRIRELGWWPPILALILYGLFLHFHQTLFGVSPLPI